MKNITNTSNQKKKNFIYLLSFWILLLFSNTTINAQEDENISMSSTQDTFILKGTVFSKTDNSVLPGTSISLKNNITGVETDIDGNFELANVKEGDIISFRFLGFVTQDLVIKKNHPFIKVYLNENHFELLGAVDTKTTYKTKRSFWQRVKAIF